MHVSSISHKTGRKHRRGFLFLLGCQTCPHRMLGARPRPQRFGFLWSGGGSSRRGIETFPACFAKAASGRHRAPLAPRCYHCPSFRRDAATRVPVAPAAAIPSPGPCGAEVLTLLAASVPMSPPITEREQRLWTAQGPLACRSVYEHETRWGLSPERTGPGCAYDWRSPEALAAPPAPPAALTAAFTR